jgi:hypothetical protein
MDLSDDVLRNLFKILCGVMNMRLRQRGLNPIDDVLLQTYLDSVNQEILDSDILLLNQLSTLKNLANRRFFSIDERQIVKIHRKFINMFEQRMIFLGSDLPILPPQPPSRPQPVVNPYEQRSNMCDRKQ